MRTVRVNATSAGGVLYVGAGGISYLGSDEDIAGMRSYQQWTIICYQGDRRMAYSGPSILYSLHGWEEFMNKSSGWMKVVSKVVITFVPPPYSLFFQRGF
jgi:hypothetical protein